MDALRLSLLLFAFGVAGLAAEFPGTWTNGKSEFQAVSLLMRADGQAAFAMSVVSAYGPDRISVARPHR